MNMKVTMHINLDKIRIDCDTQGREKNIPEKIDEYAEKMLMGEVFDPAIVYYDGREYYLSDGFHRYFANKKIGSPGMDCEVREGLLRDAQFYAIKANNTHGMPPNNADKRMNVIKMLNDFEWGMMTQLEIAKQCGCTQQTVSKIKQELFSPKSEASNTKTDSKPLADKKSDAENKKAEAEKNKADEDKNKADEDRAHELIQLEDAVVTLEEENQQLSDRLAVAAMDGTDEEKKMAESIISGLRAEISMMEMEMKAVKQSRDSFQSENAQLKKQIASLMNKIKKMETK